MSEILNNRRWLLDRDKIYVYVQVHTFSFQKLELPVLLGAPCR